ncbi:FtsX-like permease family protein [Microbacterium sp. RURRCA19A]|nr:FtsX-like permease family protein [Microbacterium sp. RURRCA19A]
MFIGVLALVGVSAASSIASDMLVAYEEQTGGRAVTMTAQVDVPPQDLGSAGRALVGVLHTRLGNVGNAVVSAQSTVFLRTPAELANNEAASVLDIEWDAGDLTSIRRLAVTYGRFPLSDEELPPAIAVNEVAARQLGFPERASFFLGTSPDERGALFTVAAVIADGGTDPKAYGNLSAYASLLGTSGLGPLAIRVTSPHISQQVSAGLVADAAADLGLALSSPAVRTDTTWRVAAQIETLSVIFTLFAVVMLLVAAIGLLNVGLSSVGERARELVIRRAIGANRWDVFLLVMGSSLAMATVVALLATGAAVVLVYAVAPSLVPAGSVVGAPPFPWVACAVGCAAAALTAIAGAAIPAMKAARLPVALALRE